MSTSERNRKSWDELIWTIPLHALPVIPLLADALYADCRAQLCEMSDASRICDHTVSENIRQAGFSSATWT